MPRPALFLDRDGVINLHVGYITSVREFLWIGGVFETVRVARSLGLLIVVVTNQAGIAKGYLTEDTFNALTSWMSGQFADHKAQLDAVYFCPYHADGMGKYRVANHPDRKPNPGMILRAAAELDIELGHSALIGDQPTDIEAAAAAGVPYARRFVVSGSPLARDESDTLVGHGQVQQWLRSVYGTHPPV